MRKEKNRAPLGNGAFFRFFESFLFEGPSYVNEVGTVYSDVGNPWRIR